MEFVIQCTCKCGNSESVKIKKTINQYEDKIYESYSSITDTTFKLFKLKQSCDNIVGFECLECGNNHDLST
jgi:tRNA(Ile)-lysidine synthase TilS/MesJ